MGNVLDAIESPADIKSFSLVELEALAGEIRERLIQTLSRTGGHLGPNLGVVELTIAMHYVFDTPSDKFVFDVSHQAYVHKLLTGRVGKFDTMRQPGGLKRLHAADRERTRCLRRRPCGYGAVCGVGDGGGPRPARVERACDCPCRRRCFHQWHFVREALNNIADQTNRMIVVLNDNEWSIDRNVGAIARYLHKIVTNEHVSHLHGSAARVLERLAGKTAVSLVRKAEEAAKGLLWPSVFFRGVRPYLLWPARRP